MTAAFILLGFGIGAATLGIIDWMLWNSKNRIIVILVSYNIVYSTPFKSIINCLVFGLEFYFFKMNIIKLLW